MVANPQADSCGSLIFAKASATAAAIASSGVPRRQPMPTAQVLGTSLSVAGKGFADVS